MVRATTPFLRKTASLLKNACYHSPLINLGNGKMYAWYVTSSPANIHFERQGDGCSKHHEICQFHLSSFQENQMKQHCASAHLHPPCISMYSPKGRIAIVRWEGHILSFNGLGEMTNITLQRHPSVAWKNGKMKKGWVGRYSYVNTVYIVVFSRRRSTVGNLVVHYMSSPNSVSQIHDLWKEFDAATKLTGLMRAHTHTQM